MSSSTQNIGRTYKKLASSWDKKRGTRDCHANVFNATTAKEPLYHVASLMNHVLCDLHTRTNIAEELERLEPNAVMVATDADADSIWIYDMRASDAAPRTEQDTARLKWFVTLFIKKHFDTQTQIYLLQHIAISICFFAWFFATPNYFYATKEVRQTTRYGIQKIWTEVLLHKRPLRKHPPQATNALPNKNRGAMHQKNRGAMHQKNRGAMHQKDSILPKLEEEKRATETKIETLVQSEHPTHVFDWADPRNVHIKVSECFDMNGKHYINGKKSKKLQSLYQEYQRVQDKVARTKKGIASAEAQQQRTEKLLSLAQEEQAQEEQAQEEQAQEEQAQEEQAQEEQDADTKEPDDIPESWEDLV